MKTRARGLAAAVCVLLVALGTQGAAPGQAASPGRPAGSRHARLALAATEATQQAVPGATQGLVVKLGPGLTRRMLQSAAAAEGAVLPAAPGLAQLGYDLLIVPAGQASSLQAQLQRTPGILSVEQAQPVTAADTQPNDPDWPSQYGPAHVQAPHAWDMTTGGSSVVIAIVDTGLDFSHPDLAAHIWHNPGEIAGNRRDDDGDGYVDDVSGWDFANHDNRPDDDHGHGTHVAGIAGAIGNNGVGIAGMTWGAQLMPLKVLGSDGTGMDYDIAGAIMYATRKGARVINLSLGGSGLSSAVQAAVDYAYGHGVTVVAAAGNGGNASVLEPAAYDNVLAVVATDGGDMRTAYSNYGSAVDFAAPGDGILSTMRGGGYGVMSGTSMAAPHVSGAAALLASLPGFEVPARIRDALAQTALDRGSRGWDPYYGSGLIQVYSAMHVAPGAFPPPCAAATCWKVFLPVVERR